MIHILNVFGILCFSSFGSINSQFVFPDQINHYINPLPIFPNQYPSSFLNPYGNNNINNNNNNRYNPQQIQKSTTTPNRPYYAQQQPSYYQPAYQQQQRITTTTRRPYIAPSPQQNRQNVKRLSEQKCEEYVSKTQMNTFAGSLGLITSVHTIKADQCDTSQGLIIGGENSKAGEFPHMVAIGYRNIGSGISFSCGGTLISERYILTAAHCKKGPERQDAYIVRLGDLNLKVREKNLPELDILIERFIAHEHYDGVKKKNDIAVVKLSRDISFGKFIRPACLMTSNNLAQDRQLVATGWGLTKADSRDTSDLLQKVNLPLINNDRCNSLLDHTEYTIDNTQLCAGEMQGGKDTCQGDSGGPLQITSDSDKCVFVVVGVTSFGLICGQRNSPGVYTRVSAYLDWIENKVWRS